ncbi:MAG: hypothetical protein CME43_01350 [Haliea sp.]|nr:hypothetical protein [Haliea sp.]
MRNVPREQIRRAPYAIQAEIPEAQHHALIDHALELGGPPGTVIARQITTPEGRFVEILLGWERLQAFLHRDAFPRAPAVPIGLIDCNAAEAAFYAIEYAARDHAASGLVTSPLLYAAAAHTAMGLFGKEGKPWKIQTMANALSIARPTLSNRLRLLNGLAPVTRQLLQQGLLKPEMAKILLAEPSPTRQERLAHQAAKGMMSTRSLYRLVHPGYEPPQLVAQPRGNAAQRLGDVGLMERELAEHYGTPTAITLDAKQHKGTVELAFHTLSELKGLLDKLDHQIQTDTLLRGQISLSVDNSREANALLLELGANRDPELT